MTILWHKYVGLDGKVVGIDRFGLSAPAPTVFKELGVTTEALTSLRFAAKFSGVEAETFDGAMSKMTATLGKAARRWYRADGEAPLAYEPSLDDFLSPALVEALLMQEVLDAGEFVIWLERFSPRGFGALAEPPTVLDHADPKQSHLDGLCLSRAWCFERLGDAAAAAQLIAAALPHIAGGDYAGEHWLASYAVLALSAAALKTP